MKLIKVLGTLAIVVIGMIVLVLAIILVVYPPEYVYRVLVWQDSDATAQFNGHLILGG